MVSLMTVVVSDGWYPTDRDRSPRYRRRRVLCRPSTGQNRRRSRSGPGQPHSQHVRSIGPWRANMKVMVAESADNGTHRRRRWWYRGPFVHREVRLSVGTLLVFLFVFYVAFPLLASHRSEVNALAHINIAYLALGVLLEIAALAAYTQLTHAVLPSDGPRRFRLFRINMSTLALSHVSPGGTAPGAALGLPPAHPVRRQRSRRRVRPRHPGHRVGGGPQRDVLALPGGLPGDPRLPRPGQPSRRPVPVGLHPGHRGRRGRGGAARGLRRPLLPLDQGPGAGQPGHPPVGGPDPVPRRRPDHRPGRAVGRPVRGHDARTGP